MLPKIKPPNPNQTKKTDQNLFSCIVNLVEPSFALYLGCKRAEATRALELFGSFIKFLRELEPSSHLMKI